MDGERRIAARAGLDPGAHQPERLRDPVHGPAPDRVVAVEREGKAALEREPARQQSHQRARVADVDRSRRGLHVAQAAAPDHQLIGAPLHDRPQHADCGERGLRIGRVKVIADADGFGGHR
jgi:hypothetical protein